MMELVRVALRRPYTVAVLLLLVLMTVSDISPSGVVAYETRAPTSGTD